MKIVRIKIALFFLTLGCLKHSYTQNGSAIIPLDVNQFPTFMAARNPSLLHTIGDTTLNMIAAYQGYTGIRSSNNLTYLSTSRSIKKNPSSKGNFIGVHLTNEVNGKFFRTFRLYVDYQYATYLNSETSLNAGVSLGLYNFRVVGNQYTSGSSIFSNDGNIGISINHRNLRIGASIMQVFNSEIIYTSENSFLQRHYYFSGTYKQRFGVINTEYLAAITYIPENIIQGNIGCTIEYQNKFTGQIILSHPEGLDIGLGIKNLNVYSGMIDLLINYNLYTTNNYIPASKYYEIGLIYKI